MIKNLIFAFMGIVFLASCEKKYTCTCVYPGSSIGTTETTFKAKKKADAESSCAAQNVGANANGGSCAL